MRSLPRASSEAQVPVEAKGLSQTTFSCSEVSCFLIIAALCTLLSLLAHSSISLWPRQGCHNSGLQNFSVKSFVIHLPAVICIQWEMAQWVVTSSAEARGGDWGGHGRVYKKEVWVRRKHRTPPRSHSRNVHFHSLLQVTSYLYIPLHCASVSLDFLCSTWWWACSRFLKCPSGAST